MHGGLTRTLAAAVIWSASACATPAPTVTPSPAPPPRLTVVTWNLGAGRGDLSALVADLESGRLNGTPAGEYVLLLQEVIMRADPSAALPARLPRPLSLVVARTRPDAGNAIASTLPLDGQWTIDLPRARQPRSAAGATIRVNGQPFFVVSTHLENRLGLLRGLFGDRARARQAEALVAALPPGPGIVGGDMNTMLGPREPALLILRRRFPDLPAQEEPTFGDRLALDHLFFDLPEGWTAAMRVIPEDYGSDHRPVLGELYRP